MTDNSNSRPLPVIIGERLRMFREAKNLRQEDVADVAKRYGLTWGRSSIASLEAGTRELSISELLLLPSILQQLGGWEESLIPPAERIRINERIELLPHMIGGAFFQLISPTSREQSSLVADEVTLLGTVENTPPRSRDDLSQAVARDVHIYNYILYKLWPDFRYDRDDTKDYTHGYAVISTIADRLTTPRGKPYWALVRAFSLGMWGRLPGDERDARVDERRFDSKRALQSARGHMTRAMIEELQQELDTRWPEVESAFNELERVIDEPEALDEWSDKVRELEYTALGMLTKEKIEAALGRASNRVRRKHRKEK